MVELITIKRTIFSIFSLLAYFGYNVSLYELGLNWPYPVLSLLFSSSSSIIVYGVTWLLINLRNKRPRSSSYHNTTNINTNNVTTPNLPTAAWKWEFPTSAEEGGSTLTNPINKSAEVERPKQVEFAASLVWAKHKHFIVCGGLLAGYGICTVFMISRVSYHWQLFSFMLIVPATFTISEYSLKKTSTWLKRGLAVVLCGGLINGIFMVLSTNFSGWYGMFGASLFFMAIFNVYQSYLYNIQNLHVIEVATWSHVYFLVVALIISPIYAFAGVQDTVHNYSDLFWYQRQGITCLTDSKFPCHPYAWLPAAGFVLFYFLANMQVAINSLALPLMALVYIIIKHSISVNFPLLSIVVIIVGLVVCKLQVVVDKEYSALMKQRETRF